MKKIEKLLNRFGYYKLSQMIQPTIIKSDVYAAKTYKVQLEVEEYEVRMMPEAVERKLVEPLAEKLPTLCEITKEKTERGKCLLTATLRLMEREG